MGFLRGMIDLFHLGGRSNVQRRRRMVNGGYQFIWNAPLIDILKFIRGCWGYCE